MLFYTIGVESEEERSKIEEIYYKYHVLMLKRANMMLQDQMEAEDAVHESFIKIIRNLKQIGEVDSSQTKRYCIVVLEHTVIDMLRKKKRQSEYLSDDMELYESQASVDPSDDMKDILIEGIKNLPILYRDVMVLRYGNQMEISEIAKCFEISEEAVRKRISRARQMLKEYCLGGERNV